jgi:uncharacterized membrane protein
MPNEQLWIVIPFVVIILIFVALMYDKLDEAEAEDRRDKESVKGEVTKKSK